MDVGTWLRSLEFDHHVAAFEENGVDGALLRELTNEDLKDLGVTRLAERKRLLKAIADLSALTDETLGSASSTDQPAGPERRHLTVMFCDLVGSTELSTRLDPEEFGNIVRAYQDACTTTIESHGGTIAKYMGDGVLVYFGFPQAQEDDAERAVHAGLGVIDAVAALGSEGMPLHARVGIATGLVVVGEQIGRGTAQEQAVVGETPNLAARLESIANPGAVVISDSTYRLTGQRFETEDLGTHSLKGFSAPVQAWHVTGIDIDATRFEATRAAGGLTPLVGRDREIELMIGCWRRAKAGHGQVVLLSGEAGIGKSRILKALQEHLEDEPHTRLRYNCSPQHTNSALYPVICQLEAAAGFAREDSVDRKLDKLQTVLQQSSEDVATVAPLLAALLSLPAEERYGALDMEPKQQKEATMAALMAQLEGLAARQPVAMYLEDVHWIDPTTLELFDRLIDRIAAFPVLLVMTFRPEFEVPWELDENLHGVALERLGRTQVVRVIDGITGGRRLPDSVVEEIHARTDGVPLFVEELTKSLLESALLREDGAQFVLEGPLRQLRVPATLQESLLARLDRLAPIKEVAQVGAALGRVFSHAVLAAVTEFPEPALRDALVQLEDAELLFRRGRPPEATYRFKHALVQDAAYQSMLRSSRAQLHQKIARILQERFPDTADAAPDLLAQHLTEAGETEAAIAAWRRAARRAVDLAALAEGEAQLGRALDLLLSLPETEGRASTELDLRIEFGQALMATKGYMAPQTGQNFLRALELCETVGATTRIFPVLYGRWSALYASGQVNRCKELAEKILGLAEENADSGVMAMSHRIYGTASLVCGDPRLANHHFERSLDNHDPDGHRSLAKLYGQDLGVATLSGQSLALWHLGLIDQARACSDAAIESGRALGHANTLAYALVHNCVALQMLCQDLDAAQRVSAELQRIARDHDMGLWLPICDMLVCAIRAYREPSREHNAAFRQAILALGERINFELWTPMFLCWLAETEAAADQFSEGLSTLSDIQTRIDELGEKWVLPELYRLRGTLILARRDNDPDEAEQWLGRAISTARQMHARTYELRAATSLAALLSESGENAKARAVLTPAYERFTEGFDTPILQNAKATLDRLQ